MNEARGEIDILDLIIVGIIGLIAAWGGIDLFLEIPNYITVSGRFAGTADTIFPSSAKAIFLMLSIPSGLILAVAYLKSK